jgi:hypothetical protein
MKPVRFVLLIAALSGSGVAWPQDDAAQDEQVNHVRLRAETFELFRRTGADDPRPARLSSEPVLAYSDPARVLQQSGLWLWTEAGRPQALLAIEFNPMHEEAGQVQPDVWTFEAATLHETGWRVRSGDRQWDLSHGSGIDLDIESNSPPLPDRSARLRQMKQLARQFRAETTSPDEGEISLRLLPNPLYRYGESVDGVLDGALFVFVYGTNPEVTCAIEAVSGEEGSRWTCGFAPLTACAVNMEWRGRSIWRAERFSGPGTRHNYVNGRVPDSLQQSERSQ